TVKTAVEDTKVYHIDSAEEMKDQIDVMVLCGGSASDIPEQGPYFAGLFNTVDAYDNHGEIPKYFAEIDQKAKEANTTCVISTGWDPGMFSLNRLLAQSILPKGSTYSFWGKGVSQGHSDAVRRVEGVKDGKQYTIPIEKAVEAVRNGENPEFATREKHKRVCYLVTEEGADQQKIENDIKTMPGYFADYDTEVHFITKEELEKEHSGLPHGGRVIHYGKTGLDGEHGHTIEYKLDLESNPDFTASVMLAYVRAAYRMNREGQIGAKTVFDVAPIYLSERTPEELRAAIL
ncbi:MAG TPA: diaminopimelate dehydrogenase, partial [Eubacteriaceae bacterium]|nr:diaminopimelate dehydrogenase [Eubacteriaceae bacterium]